MKLWIAVWSHRHGVDVFPLWCADGHQPTEADAVALIDDYEPERQEWVAIHGPMDIPDGPMFKAGDSDER